MFNTHPWKILSMFFVLTKCKCVIFWLGVGFGKFNPTLSCLVLVNGSTHQREFTTCQVFVGYLLGAQWIQEKHIVGCTMRDTVRELLLLCVIWNWRWLKLKGGGVSNSKVVLVPNRKVLGFSVVIHSVGSWVMNPTLKWEGKKENAYHDLDIDTWSFLEVVDLIHNLEYSVTGRLKMWWKGTDADYETLSMGGKCL